MHRGAGQLQEFQKDSASQQIPLDHVLAASE